jgi:hypothetical protein
LSAARLALTLKGLLLLLLHIIVIISPFLSPSSIRITVKST